MMKCREADISFQIDDDVLRSYHFIQIDSDGGSCHFVDDEGAERPAFEV